jgi:hypothetical protein
MLEDTKKERNKEENKKMAKYSGSGWHRQSTRHSNARKYGRAGGTYSGWRTMTSAQRHNAKLDRIMENWHQQLKEKDNLSKQEYNKPYDELSNKEKHKIDYKHAEKKPSGEITKEEHLPLFLLQEKELKKHFGEALPIYKIKGKFYFLDKRLGEYRNIKDPSDRLDFNDVPLEDLQKPTKGDSEKVFGKHYGKPDEEHWIEAVLKNDEGSTNEELIDHFMKEGNMSKEKAQFYVDQRQRLTLKPLQEDLVPYKSKEEQEKEASLYEGEAQGYFTKKQVEKLLKHGERLGETKKNYGKSEDEQMLEAWYERIEEGLGRKLTKKEKEKEKRLMI